MGVLPKYRRMFIKKMSPNYNDRRGVSAPDMIILHYTGMETAQAALDRLCDPASEVSAHYLIERDGKITQMVAEDKRAWHAGVSHWRGVTDINSHSIGVELENRGHEFGYEDFPPPQIDALIGLCHEIIGRHNIKWVLGHEDVAPDRKQDPGEKFPWDVLEEAGIQREM